MGPRVSFSNVDYISVRPLILKRSIIFVLPIGPSLGGVTTWSISLAQALLRRGRHSLLILHRRIKGRPTLTLPADLPFSECQGPPAYYAKKNNLNTYSQTYEQQLPALFIPNWSDAAYYTCALVAAKYPSLTRIIAVAHADEDYYYQLLCRYESSIHLFVAVSQTIADKLVALLPHRSAQIHNRIYFVDHMPLWRDKPAGPLVITYAGRIEENQKRVSDLVAIFSILSNAGLVCKINIVGDGDRLPHLKSDLDKLLFESSCQITYHGLLPRVEMFEIWSQSHIMLQCSAFEGSSIAMLEAMASGCVPVVTAVSGARSLIVHGENGFLSPVGDVASLAQSILHLSADEGLLRHTARSAHQTIRNCCSMDSYVDWFLSMEGLVWSMDDRGSRPAFSLPLASRPQPGLISFLKGYWRLFLAGITHLGPAS